MHAVFLLVVCGCCILRTGSEEVTLSEEIYAKIDPSPKEQSSKVSILSSPSLLSVHIGDTVLLPCRVENPGKYVLIWKKGRSSLLFSGTIKATRDEKFSLVNGSSLQISQVGPEYAGEYICQISSTPKELVHVLHVLVPPKAVTDPEDGLVIVKKGDPVHLRCSAEGYPEPEITWRAIKGSLPGGLKKKYGSVLSFPSIDTDHNGMYECTAENGIGEPSVTLVRIKVLYSPEISVSPIWVHAGAGSTIELTCTASADPAAHIFWTRNLEGTPLSENKYVAFQHSTLSTTKTQQKIRIQRIIREYFGSYVCFANNSLGSTSRTVEISGLAEPVKFKSNSSGDEKHSFHLVWTVKSYSPVIEYMLRVRERKSKNASGRPGPWNDVMIPVQNEQTVLFSHSYNITGLEPNTDYEVVIQARNDYGWNHPNETFVFRTAGNGEPQADATEETTLEPSLLHIRATETSYPKAIVEDRIEQVEGNSAAEKCSTVLQIGFVLIGHYLSRNTISYI